MKTGKLNLIVSSSGGRSSHSVAKGILDRFADYGYCSLALNGNMPKVYVIVKNYLVCEEWKKRAEFYKVDPTHPPLKFFGEGNLDKTGGGAVIAISKITSINHRGLVADAYTVKSGLLKMGEQG